MKYFDQLAALLSKGESVVIIHDQDAEGYARRLAQSDPRESSERPVALWRRDAGFWANSEFPEELPDLPDFAKALKWAARCSIDAIFVFGGGDLATLSDWEAAKRILAAVRLQADERALSIVIVSESPLPPDLTNVAECLGGGDAERTVASAGPSAAATRDWRDLEDLADFDTPEWERRLDALTPQEVEDIVGQKAHRHSIKRINDLRGELAKRFESREKIIDALCCAAIAQVPTVLIGPPGTAKSALVRALCEGLGLTARRGPEGQRLGGRNYFEYMLTRFTTPEEIFGPWHLKDLIENQIYRRVTTGHLPEARIAFLDEIFKASGAILNTLLTLLNEKLFYNGGRPVRVPLIMAFAASNELPTDENLRALVDRFPLRILCPRVDRSRRENLIQRAWEQGYDRQFSSAGVVVEQLACPNDLRLLHQVLRVVHGGRRAFGRTANDFQAEFMKFFDRFVDLVSDRTAPQLLGFARAHALLLSQDGRAARGIPREALEVYRYVSCDEQHQRNCDVMFRQTESRL